MAFSQKCKSFVQMSPFAALSLWYFFSWKRRELISKKKKKDSKWFSNVKIYTNFDIYREFPPQCHYCHTSKVQNFRLNGIVSILMGLVEISEYFRLFHSIHEQKKKRVKFLEIFLLLSSMFHAFSVVCNLVEEKNSSVWRQKNILWSFEQYSS